MIEPDEEWLEQQVIRGGDALARVYGGWSWSLDRWRSIAALVLVASGDPAPAPGSGGGWRSLPERLSAVGYAGFAELARELVEPRRGHAGTRWPNGRPVEAVRDRTEQLLRALAYEAERAGPHGSGAGSVR